LVADIHFNPKAADEAFSEYMARIVKLEAQTQGYTLGQKYMSQNAVVVPGIKTPKHAPF
jgi:hypothetical protein